MSEKSRRLWSGAGEEVIEQQRLTGKPGRQQKSITGWAHHVGPRYRHVASHVNTASDENQPNT